MRKIPTLFVRNPDDRKHVLPEVTPGCEWVPAGEGIATRKYDGTCVMFDGERWWARREVKRGKMAPPGFREEQFDGVTGKTVGWEPAEQSSFARLIADATPTVTAPDDEKPGTYELIGPKVNGNPEGLNGHWLVRHGATVVSDAPRTYDDLARWLPDIEWEGIVWHHPDGRMAKIKRRDFV